MTYTPLSDIIGNVVQAMNKEQKVYFLPGRRSEIATILSAKSDNQKLKFEKYPLVCLFLDDPTEKIGMVDREVKVDLAFVVESRPEWFTTDRIDQTFKPVLYPMVELFFKYLRRSKNVKTEIWEYDRRDAYGLQSSNILNDYVDAVEVLNLNLKLYENC